MYFAKAMGETGLFRFLPLNLGSSTFEQLQPRARADAEQRRADAEQRRVADAAAVLGVPAQRPRRGAALAANAAMDNLHARGELQ